MNEQLVLLAQARIATDLAKEKRDKAASEYRATPEYQKFKALDDAAKVAQETEELSYRDYCVAALDNYSTTGDTEYPGCKIAMYSALEYDPAIALEWAAQHHQKALKLDKREFEKAAKVMELAFVTVTKQPRPRVERDLTKYLDVQVD